MCIQPFHVLLLLSLLHSTNHSVPTFHSNPRHSIVKRVINGRRTTIDQFPFIVALKVFNSDENAWTNHCAGVIISDHWFVTSAHCLAYFRPQQILVLEGFTDISQGKPLEPGESIHTIKHWFLHETWLNTPGPFVFDIAIAKIHGRFMVSRQTKILESEGPYQGGVIVVGWGLVTPGEVARRSNSVLRKAQGVMMNRQTCQQRLASFKDPELHNYNFPDDSVICVTYPPDVGACLGDSGGPLLREWDMRFIGVVSFHASPFGCADPGYYDVYQNVGYFKEWIHRQMAVADRLPQVNLFADSASQRHLTPVWLMSALSFVGFTAVINIKLSLNCL